MATKTHHKLKSPLDKSKISTLHTILQSIGYLMLPILLSTYGISGEIYPFALGFIASTKSNQIPLAVLGGFIGWVTLPMGDIPLRYGVALLIIIVYHLSMNMISPAFNWHKLSPFVGAIAIGMPTMMINIGISPTVYNMVLCLCEMSLVLASSYFFVVATTSLDCPNPLIETLSKPKSPKEKLALVVSLCIILSTLYKIEIFYLNIGVIATTIILLICGYKLSSSAGAVVASGVGFAVALLSSDYSAFMAVLPLTAVVSGLFVPFGRLALSLAYTTIYIISLSLWWDQGIFNSLIDICTSCCVFILLPSRWINALVPWSNSSAHQPEQTMVNLLHGRLHHLASSISYVKEVTSYVSVNMDRIKARDTSLIYDYASNKLCKKCSNNTLCYQRYYGETMDVFGKGIDVLKSGQPLSPELLPLYFRERCINMTQLTNHLSLGYNQYLQGLRTARSVARMRENTWHQLEGISQMVDNLAHNINSISHTEPNLKKTITDYFSSVGVEIMDCVYYVDLSGNHSIQITVPVIKLPRIDKEKSSLDLSQILERDFDLPYTQKQGDEIVLTYPQIGSYKISFGIYQHSANNDSYCGDYCKQFRDNFGNAYTILSDGMGSGKEASIQSTMTVDMLEKLISSGADYPSAIQMVNASLMSKSDKEFLSTIDSVMINLYTGETQFHKAGASVSFVAKGNKILRVKSSSLPLGIINSPLAEKTLTTLSTGDVVVLLSDGATTSGEGWIASELQSMLDYPPDHIAKEICQRAVERMDGSKQDDITVAVMKVGQA